MLSAFFHTCVSARSLEETREAQYSSTWFLAEKENRKENMINYKLQEL